jgi:hypothetical protein
MKTITGAVSGNQLGARQRLARNPACYALGELAHDLFNQLTVINLCSANLSVSLQDSDDPGTARNLDMLERAAEEATKLAERIAQFIAEPKSRSAVQVAESSLSPPLPNKVLPLF